MSILLGVGSNQSNQLGVDNTLYPHDKDAVRWSEDYYPASNVRVEKWPTTRIPFDEKDKDVKTGGIIKVVAAGKMFVLISSTCHPYCRFYCVSDNNFVMLQGSISQLLIRTRSKLLSAETQLLGDSASQPMS